MPRTVNVNYVTKEVKILLHDSETESLAAATAIAAAAEAQEAKDVVVDNLQDSLDAIDEKTEAEKTELDGYTEEKKAEVSTVGQGYVDSVSQKVAEANTILSAIRNEYGYPFTAATAADMTDPSKIYVYVGNETGYVNGNWYYHNGTAWVSGGVYNAIALDTDTTLTVSGAAADAKATGDAIKSTKAEMSLFGIDDLLWANTNPVSKTENGITYTVDKTNKTVTVTGTGTAVSALSFYSRGTVFPEWLQKGKKYCIHMDKNSPILFQIGIARNGGNLTWPVADSGNFTYTIPDDATGISLRLLYPDSAIGQPVNTIVRPYITEEVNESDYRLNGKYVAFGDSIIQGAVWPATQGQARFFAKERYKIPTRIALKTGHIRNFVNEGVGGSGYVYKIDGESITDKILNYDFTGVDLITILGGPNDVAHGVGIGSSNSEAGDGTICGAVKTIIEHIKANAPKAQLVFMHTPNYQHESWNQLINSALAKICADNHVGYVNWAESPYCDNFETHSGGYNGNIGPNYSHPKVEEDYAILGDFIAGKITALNNSSTIIENEIRENAVINYTKDDLEDGFYYDFRPEYISVTFNKNVRHVSSSDYMCGIIPVRKGDTVRLKIVGGSNKAKAYAKIKYNYLIDEIFDNSTTPYFNGNIVFDYDGFLVINCTKNYAEDRLICEVISNNKKILSEQKVINAGTNQERMFPDYGEDNPCRALLRGPSMMGAIHHWGIIGASFDSGEFNYTKDGTLREIEWYEYSCWNVLKEINHIPDLYIYSDGGQNAKEWISLGANTVRGYAYASDTEVVNPYWSGRTGIGYGGGCWWKVREDAPKQAYLINLGSNDINNNYPFENPDDYDETRYYKCGTIEDIGTYDYVTDTDTVPAGKTAGVVPGVVNSYCAYMGALLQRLIAKAPDCVIFLATIRNGLTANPNIYAVWNEYNDALREIAQMPQFANNVILVDWGNYGPNFATYEIRQMIVGYHPNALAYHFIAYWWNTLLDKAIFENFKRLKQSMFIGTGKNY